MKKQINNCTEYLQKIMELVTRINLETDRAAFLNVVGHVGWLDISIAESKEKYNELIYQPYSLRFRESNWKPELNELLAWERKIKLTIERLEGFLK